MILSLVVVYLIAFVGSIFTSQNTGTDWYDSIKPDVTPPSYVFPIVWNILFLLIAISLYIAYTKANKKQKTKVIGIFALNLILNALWSIFFFAMKNPKLAFFELIVLWITIWMMIFTTYKINKTSAWLLVPYLLWVGFAGFLNFTIAFGRKNNRK